MIQSCKFSTPDISEQSLRTYKYFSRLQEMDKIGKGDVEDTFLSQVYQFTGKDLKEKFIIQYLDHLK